MFRTILLFTMLTFSFSSFAQSTDTENKIKALITGSFESIWSDLDAATIKNYHTDDFLLLEHGEVWTNKTISEYTEKAKQQSPLPKRHNRFDFISIRIKGNMAWVAYHNYANWTVAGKEAGKMQWLESATAILTEDGWRLQLLHSTRVKK